MNAKRLILMSAMLMGGIAQLSTFNFQFSTCQAQTDVTSKYIDNPNFEARFAGWVNENMTFETNNSFKQKSGMVYMQ